MGLMGPQRTVAPKRLGQYFLDLGQSDFSYSTCPICGLLYARGQEADEKVHKSFHKKSTRGIPFKGWQNERVTSRFDAQGNRIILVLADDMQHQPKIGEVIEVMELELGLTPGWLRQRVCKVYLFISSAKKIVGCLMAEPITSAFRLVPDKCQSSGNGGEQSLCEEIGKGLFNQVTKHSDGAQDRSLEEYSSSVSDLEDKEEGSVQDSSADVDLEEVLLYTKSCSLVGSEEAAFPESLVHADILRDTVVGTFKGSEDVTSPDNRKTQKTAPVRGKLKMTKITDFFPVKSLEIRKQYLAAEACEVANADNSGVSEDYIHTELQASDGQCSESTVAPSLTEGAHDLKPWATIDRNSSTQDGDSRKRRQHSSDLMLFRSKFFREVAPRKKAKKEQAQDLGRAVLYTKMPVPAVCGVRVIWVSQSDRRKGIASRLLNAMRETFCFGVILQPAQVAFSQPTPEGRKFAEQYCKTNEFLVYTRS